MSLYQGLAEGWNVLNGYTWIMANYFFVYICTKNENSGPCNMRKINSEIITEIV